MSDTSNQTDKEPFNEADSKADAIAIFLLISIAVGAMIYFVS